MLGGDVTSHDGLWGTVPQRRGETVLKPLTLVAVTSSPALKLLDYLASCCRDIHGAQCPPPQVGTRGPWVCPSFRFMTDTQVSSSPSRGRVLNSQGSSMTISPTLPSPGDQRGRDRCLRDGSGRGLQCNLSGLQETTTRCTEAHGVVYSTPPSSVPPLPRA